MFSLKIGTLNKSKILIFICIGKWANEGLKTQSLLVQPSSFTTTKASLPWKTRELSSKLCTLRRSEGKLRCDEAEASTLLSWALLRQSLSFIAVNASPRQATYCSLATLLSLHLISSITLLDLPSNHIKHKKMGD